MECILCHFRSETVSDLKNHYISYHSIDPANEHFLNLLKPDYLEEDNKCIECLLTFDTYGKKKKHMFLVHYSQEGGSAKSDADLPLNVLKRGPITHFSINFDQHKNVYDFYSGDMADEFLGVVERKFKPLKNIEHKFQVYFEIVNQQRTLNNRDFLTDNRSWLTKVYTFKFFNKFVRNELKNEITKRIIISGLTGSSWYFRRFKRMNVIVTSLTKGYSFITG